MYPYFHPYTPAYVRRNDNGDALNQVLKMIQQSIAGEREDELFYDYLISVAPTQQEKQVITGIRDDERKHRRYFRSIYRQLTGENAPEQAEVEFQRPNSYLEGIERALIGELKAFEKYRWIYFNIPQQFKNAIFEIMTDEMLVTTIGCMQKTNKSTHLKMVDKFLSASLLSTTSSMSAFLFPKVSQVPRDHASHLFLYKHFIYKNPNIIRKTNVEVL